MYTYIQIYTYIWKTELTENGNGKRKFVFLGWQTLNQIKSNQIKSVYCEQGNHHHISISHI